MIRQRLAAEILEVAIPLAEERQRPAEGVDRPLAVELLGRSLVNRVGNSPY